MSEVPVPKRLASCPGWCNGRHEMYADHQCVSSSREPWHESDGVLVADGVDEGEILVRLVRFRSDQWTMHEAVEIGHEIVIAPDNVQQLIDALTYARDVHRATAALALPTQRVGERAGDLTG
jgi:hypothetical protein